MSDAHRHDPTAAIVVIGDEVLSGKVDDANGPFLVRALRARGVAVSEIRILGDVGERISATVCELRGRVDAVFTTGGIGPTHDDVTIAAIAAGFGVAVVRHPELERRVRTKYGDRTDAARLRLADVPEGAVVTLGPEGAGIVPVLQIHNVTILPGVPSLLRLCFERVAHQWQGRPFFTRTLFVRAPETHIAARLAAIQGQFSDVAIGSYPRFDEATYRVKITVDGRDEARVRCAHDTLLAALSPEGLVVEPP